MPSVLIEALCSQHGLERFRIKIIRKYNVKSDSIIPIFRKKPKKDLSSIIIGRNVSEADVKNYLFKHFQQTGLLESIVFMKITK